MQTNTLFLPALTGYRAIAAWLIFVFHLLKPNTSWPAWLQSLVGQFHIGVDMFFVLSGFLIAYRYAYQYPIHLKSFFINRVARIYPMYFILTLAFFIVTYLQDGGWSSERTIEAILSFTLTKALFEKYTFAGIDTGWTLTLEEIFYICAPFYFLLIRKSKKWLWALPIFIFLFGSTLKYLFSESTWGFMQHNISVYIFEFFAGIALAFFIRKPMHREKGKRGLITYWGLGFILAYLCVHAFVIGRIENDWLHALDVIILSVLGIIPLLFGLIYEKTFIQWVLSTPIMILLGKSSYIFYLIHKGWITNILYEYVSANFIIVFVLLNVLSIVLFKYIEEPLNIFIRTRFTSKNANT